MTIDIKDLCDFKPMKMMLQRKLSAQMCYHIRYNTHFVCCCTVPDDKMVKPTNDQRNEAIRVLSNAPVNYVAQHFGVHRTTIERLRRRKKRKGSVKDFEHSDRLRVTL